LTEQVSWKYPDPQGEDLLSTALSLPAEETTAAPSLHLVPTLPSIDVAAQEANRWMIAFGIPCLFAGTFVAAAIGSGITWLLGLALASLLTAICSLTWVAIASDTNG
jgi:hypothetical protein